MNDITFQINLSAGDVNYALKTVPVLVNAHRYSVNEKLAIVDCCPPQKTRAFDPDQRFSKSEFDQRVKQICELSEELRSQGHFDRIVYLYPNEPLQKELSHKYLRGIIQETHDVNGSTLLGYLAVLEIPKTRYVLHYDADMLLYQERGFDWSIEAKKLIDNDFKIVSATPRLCPPRNDAASANIYFKKNRGRNRIASEGGWLNDWFSSRCFFMDRNKLQKHLPLLKGAFLWETIMRKCLNRGYPPSPEVMLFRRLCQAGSWRLVLETEKVWILHPNDKSRRYLELLSDIQHAISENRFPEEQRGCENLNLSSWENFLK